MAWYTDEQYEMIKDSREKKSIAASAFKQKTHCGKGGRVKFPSDYLTNKELKAMNGECKSYRMNDAISWSEFVEWPNEHKVAYIKRIREKFGVSDQYIAEMFGVATNMFLMYLKELGLEAKIKCDENWESNKFYVWRTGGRTELVNENSAEETSVEEPDLTKPMPWADFKALTTEQQIAYIQGIRNQFSAPDRWVASAVFGISQSCFAGFISRLGIGAGKGHAKGTPKGKWDKEGFMKWCGMKSEETPVSVPLEEVVDKDKAERIEELCQDIMNTINTAVEAQERAEVFISEAEDHGADPVEKAFQEAAERVDTEIERFKSETTSASCESEANFAIPVDGDMNFEGNSDDILRTIRLLLNGSKVKMSVSWRIIKE